MHRVIVVPARLASSRLSLKPLRLIAGEPLVHLVARRVLDFGLNASVVIATDDERVRAAVRDLDVHAVMSGAGHESGTARVAEVIARKEFKHIDLILNVQGDEPFLPAEAAVGALREVERGRPIGTAAAPLDPADLTDPNRVKVVIDETGRALRFSRDYPASAAWGCGVEVRRHLGVYAYTRAALERWVRLPPTDGERRERLEQERAMEHGMEIGVARVQTPAPHGIDTPADLAWAERELAPALSGRTV